MRGGDDDVLEYLVHPEVDPLDDVAAVVEDSPYVLCVDGAGEVRVAVVGVVLLAVARPRVLGHLQEVVPDEVFGPGELPVGAVLLDLRQGLGRDLVLDKLVEVVLQLGPALRDFLLEQVLFVQEKDHRYGSQPPVVPY